MDLIILLVLIGIVIFFFRRLRNIIYLIAIVDIFLRIVTFIKSQITNYQIYAFLHRYIPTSIPGILNNYSSGILNTALIWMYVVSMIIFEFYIIKAFFRKR